MKRKNHVETARHELFCKRSSSRGVTGKGYAEISARRQNSMSAREIGQMMSSTMPSEGSSGIAPSRELQDNPRPLHPSGLRLQAGGVGEGGGDATPGSQEEASAPFSTLGVRKDSSRLCYRLILKGLWWAQQDSNLRLPPCEGGTLPLSYAPGAADHPAAGTTQHTTSAARPRPQVQ